MLPPPPIRFTAADDDCCWADDAGRTPADAGAAATRPLPRLPAPMPSKSSPCAAAEAAAPAVWFPAAVAGGAAALSRVTLARMRPLSKLGTSTASSVTSIHTTGPPPLPALPGSPRRVLKRKWYAPGRGKFWGGGVVGWV